MIPNSYTHLYNCFMPNACISSIVDHLKMGRFKQKSKYVLILINKWK